MLAIFLSIKSSFELAGEPLIVVYVMSEHDNDNYAIDIEPSTCTLIAVTGTRMLGTHLARKKERGGEGERVAA